MYKILILSDSHSLQQELVEIKNRHGLEVNLHIGDSELALDAPELSGYTTVRGNCDWRAAFPDEQLIEVGGLRIYLTHGHLYKVKSNLQDLQYRAAEVNADIVCFGHTHIAYGEKVDNRVFINPGSIRLPHGNDVATYAILEWETKDNVNLHFYSVAGKKLKTLTYSL